MTFEEVWKENYRDVWKFVNNRISNASDADDLTQNVFLTFWRVRDRFQDQGDAYKSLLIHTAKWETVKHLTNNNVQKRTAILVPIKENHSTYRPDPDTPILVRQVRKMMAKLKPTHREAVEMFYLGDLCHSDVAARTGVGRTGAEYRIKCGIKKLRQLFGVLDFATG